MNEEFRTVKDYAQMLLNSKNIILRGAPGTGKTYLAKQIARYIVSDGKYETLTEDKKIQVERQIEFVQFHPSYDYTDFVEGLRPTTSKDKSSVSFALQAGVFKQFIDNIIDNEININSIKKAIVSFVQEHPETKRWNGTIFNVSVDEQCQFVITDAKMSTTTIKVKIDDLCNMLVSNAVIKKVGDVHKFITISNKTISDQYDTYYWGVYSSLKEDTTIQELLSILSTGKYVFIIDEINRGEISKIFGELFFSVDPGYRGPDGGVKTQYANLHVDPDAKFYIPENVYIIGTMNDIDRSVDSFDFAMRRRFRFIEISAEASQIMLESLGDKKDDAISRMNRLNEAISKTEGLNENYHIGAAYFLKLNKTGVNVESLWTDFLRPLLQEYVRGMSEEKTKLQAFEDAYYLKSSDTNPKSANASGTSGDAGKPNGQPAQDPEPKEKN